MRQFIISNPVSSVTVSSIFMLRWFMPWQQPSSGYTSDNAFRTLKSDVLISQAFYYVNVLGMSSRISLQIMLFCLMSSQNDYYVYFLNSWRCKSFGQITILIPEGIPFRTLLVSSFMFEKRSFLVISLHFSVLTFKVLISTSYLSISIYHNTLVTHSNPQVRAHVLLSESDETKTSVGATILLPLVDQSPTITDIYLHSLLGIYILWNYGVRAKKIRSPLEKVFKSIISSEPQY